MILKKASRLKAKEGIELTAMVDIVFLLIIFFMTSSTLIQVRALKVDLPGTAAADSEIKKQLTLSLQKDGTLYINGRVVSMQQVTSALQKRATEEQTPVVIIEADKSVPYEQVVRLMGIAKAAGIERVSLSAQLRSKGP